LETSADLHQTAQHYIPEDRTLYIRIGQKWGDYGIGWVYKNWWTFISLFCFKCSTGEEFCFVWPSQQTSMYIACELAAPIQNKPYEAGGWKLQWHNVMRGIWSLSKDSVTKTPYSLTCHAVKFSSKCNLSVMPYWLLH
jgi:hypothetical protein